MLYTNRTVVARQRQNIGASVKPWVRCTHVIWGAASRKLVSLTTTAGRKASIVTSSVPLAYFQFSTEEEAAVAITALVVFAMLHILHVPLRKADSICADLHPPQGECGKTPPTPHVRWLWPVVGEQA
jgi:hypothetical protein